MLYSLEDRLSFRMKRYFQDGSITILSLRHKKSYTHSVFLSLFCQFEWTWNAKSESLLKLWALLYLRLIIKSD